MPRPLYVMLKPPPPSLPAIEHCRRHFAIDTGYGADRLHVTVLPLGDGDALSASTLAAIRRTFDAAAPDPFAVTFDRLRGNLLVGTKTHGIRALRRLLRQRLTAAGVALPPYDAAPHITLAYAGRRRRDERVAPIGWQVTEFRLIQSIHGAGRHVELGRWPLLRRQLGLFD